MSDLAKITSPDELQVGDDYLIVGHEEGQGWLLAYYRGNRSGYTIFVDKLALLEDKVEEARFLSDWLFDDVRRGVTKIYRLPDYPPYDRK